ncbi:MAG: DUF1294 domain-containing protein [Bariatricus sp.]|nr:DUF1294 domain-containing protein [Bariatricus sp.]
MWKITGIYLLIVNLTAFFLYGIDKKRAIKQKWRISEKTLILIAVIGGSVGAICGMQVFRHKTKHIKFKFGLPAILIVQLGIVYMVFRA